MKPIREELHGAEMLVQNSTEDPEIRDLLERKRIRMEVIERGRPLIDQARIALYAREALEGTQMGVTERMKAEYLDVVRDVNAARFVARTKLEGRPDLLSKLAMPRSTRRPKGDERESSAPPAEAAKPAAAEPKPRRPQFVPYLGKAETFLALAVEDEEVLSAMADGGYTAEDLATLLSRVRALRAQDIAQELAKGRTMAGTGSLRDAVRGLRRWLVPLRKRIRTALRGRPELKKRLGLAA